MDQLFCLPQKSFRGKFSLMFDGRLSCMCVQSWPLDVVCTGLWSAGARLRRKRANPTSRLRLDLFFVLHLFERGFFL